MVPVFEQHPTLLSLRASFQPRAVAGADFSSAAPRTLVALGFVNFDSVETLAIMLERCSLEHFWFSANSEFANVAQRGDGLGHLTAVLQKGLQKVRTLSLPSNMPEEVCAAWVTALCPNVELLCRMRIGSPPFGTAALATMFEPVPDCGGVVVRRSGTSVGLAANGALWAPYTQGDSDMVTLSPSGGAQAQKKQDRNSMDGGHQSCARAMRTAMRTERRDVSDASRRAFAAELAAAAARHRAAVLA